MELIDKTKLIQSILSKFGVRTAHRLRDFLEKYPTVEAIPKDHITKAIDKVEEYICDVETDTVKAQGMAQALDIFEKALGEVEE